MNNDLISREALRREIKKECNSYGTTIDFECCKRVLDIIDNASPVEIATKLQPNCNNLQGKLACEVWKLYEKHHSHLATHVIEFGDELKDLLGKYQKGGAE